MSVRVVLFFSLLTGCLAEDFTVSCGDEASEPFVFQPSDDGVQGRYHHQWCTDRYNDTIEVWELLIHADDDTEKSQCIGDIFSYGTLHSEANTVVNQKFNCSKICFTIKLDLIYGGCYTVQDSVRIDKKTVGLQTYNVFVDNPYTVAYFEDNSSRTLARVEDEKDAVTVHYYFSRMPCSEHTFELRDPNDTEVLDLNTTCSGCGPELICRVELPAPPAGGWQGAGQGQGEGAGAGGARWELIMHRHAAWCHGAAFKINFCSNKVVFSHNLPAPHPVVQTSSTQWLLKASVASVAAVAAVAGVGAAAGGLLLWRYPPGCWGRQVKARCRLRYEPSAAEAGAAVDSGADSGRAGAGAGAGAGGIVLLYARDAEPFMRAVAALRDMLRELTNEEVYDLFAPSTVQQYAASPARWLPAALAHCRVLVIQTAALTELYQVPAAGPRDLQLAQPLLGSLVQYRRPQYGDALLSAALAILRDNAHKPGAYKKYYLCSLTELEVDMMPHVVPFRRYELPQAAALLLTDLTAGAPHPGASHPGPPHPGAPHPGALITAPPQKMEEFKRSLQEYLDYVRNYPDYLQDLLTFL